MRRANKIRAQLSRNQKREIGLHILVSVIIVTITIVIVALVVKAVISGLAIMLFCVVIVFFFCNFLALVVNILEVIWSNSKSLQAPPI